MQTVYVTNRSGETHRIQLRVQALQASRWRNRRSSAGSCLRMFGHGEPDKEQYMARLSMIKTKNDIPEGLKILSKIEISDAAASKKAACPRWLSECPCLARGEGGGKTNAVETQNG